MSLVPMYLSCDDDHLGTLLCIIVYAIRIFGIPPNFLFRLEDVSDMR